MALMRCSREPLGARKVRQDELPDIPISQIPAQAMKTMRVPPRAKTLNDLLTKARRQAVILETAQGERFVLASIEGWQGYPLAKDGDLTKNKKLMKHLQTRRSGGKPIGLTQLKAELGID
jgi:hypothetical protein